MIRRVTPLLAFVVVAAACDDERMSRGDPARDTSPRPTTTSADKLTLDRVAIPERGFAPSR